MLLFGLPDMDEERTKYGLEIPALGSLILTHSLDKQVPALKDFPKEDRPNSTIVFWSFRIMVGMGLLMITLGLVSLWLRYRHRLYHSRPFQWFALCMGPAGLVALLAGWVTTEVGRQPWVVYGYLRTIDAVSLHSTLQMSISLLAFFVVYSSVFGVGYVYLIRLIKKGPQPVDTLTSNTSGTPPSAVCRGVCSGTGEKLMGVDISVIWFAIIVFATLMYIIMDGFDLGIGLLFNFVGDAKERDVMVNSVAPVWDGNETAGARRRGAVRRVPAGLRSDH